MKIIAPAALAFVVFASGCLQVPPESAQRLDRTRRLYNDVKTGMTKVDLINTLGQPHIVEGRVCYWEDSYGRMNRESLQVEFDSGGKVFRIQIKHLEVNQPPVPAPTT